MTSTTTLTATIALFPLARQIKMIQTTADEIAARQGDAANLFWRDKIATLRGQMLDTGACRSQIECELLAFADNVFFEVSQRQV